MSATCISTSFTCGTGRRPSPVARSAFQRSAVDDVQGLIIPGWRQWRSSADRRLPPWAAAAQPT
jgi:hypothetical protein